MTLSLLIFLNCTCIGIITGILSDCTYFVKKLFKSNFIICFIIDFLVFFIGATLVFVVACKMNYNIFAFYEILGFILGVFLEKISCSNLFAKFLNLLYNGLVKLLSKIKLTKFGRLISK